MIFEIDLLPSFALTAGALVVAVILVLGFVRWRHGTALARARTIAVRLREPTNSLAAVEDHSAAVDELSQFSDVKAAVQAARECLPATDAAVRSAAIEILRRTRALDRWARDLRRGGYRTKLRAIEALGEVGDERAVDQLVEALGDDDPGVSRAASRAILKRDPDYAADRLASALASPNRRVAETAAATLVRMGDDGIDPLVSQLTTQGSRGRRLAAESLGMIGGVELAKVLRPLLETDPDAEVRVAAAEALARIGADTTFPELRRLARSDGDWFVRARVHSLLAEANAPGAAEFLRDELAATEADLILCDEEAEEVSVVIAEGQRLRTAIISGLRLLGVSEEEINEARRRASRLAFESAESAESVRGQDSEDCAGLIRALRARDSAQRAEAAGRLAAVGRAAIPALRQALSDPDPLVRIEAARSLGRIGAVDALESLAKCLLDPQSDVRLSAATAMRAIVTRAATRELSESE